MTEVPKKKQLDLAEDISKIIPCQTNVGVVYARPLRSGKWSTVSASDEPPTIGEAAIRALTGPEEKAGDETRLDDESFSRLSSDDIQNLAHAVAKVNLLGDLRDGITPYVGLGELILLKRQETKKEVQRLIDQARSSTLFGGAFSSTTKLPGLHAPDFRNTPIDRAATASEQTAEQIQAGLLLWEQQLEADKQTAVEFKEQAQLNLAIAQISLRTARLTMWVTIGLALIALTVQIGQTLWTERGSAEERTKQEETARLRHEATIQVLREQLSAQQRLISQQPLMPTKKNKASESKN